MRHISSVSVLFKLSTHLLLWSAFSICKGQIRSKYYSTYNSARGASNSATSVSSAGRDRNQALIGLCGVSCTKNSDCVAFDTDTNKRSCTLYSKIPSNSGSPGLFVPSDIEDTTYQLHWLSAGMAGIFCILINGSLAFIQGSFGNPLYYENQWVILTERVSLNNLDVGKTSVWGTDFAGGIWCKANITAEQPSGIAWTQTDGWARQSTVSDLDDSVWVVNGYDQLFHREGISSSTPCGTSWSYKSPNVKYADAGPSGLWAILSTYNAAFTADNGGTWQLVGNGFIMIASGNGQVCATSTAGSLLCRSAITALSPTGQTWIESPVTNSLRQFTLSMTCQLFGVNPSNVMVIVNACLL